MVEEELKLEVFKATLMKNGDVIIAPRPAGGFQALGFGLPMIAFGLYASLGGFDFAFLGLFALTLGGVLIYVALSGLTAPEITIDITNKIIRYKKRGVKEEQKWQIADLCHENKQPFSISGLRQVGMGVVRARLAIDLDRSILLFVTGNRRNAMKIAHWISNALEIGSADIFASG